MYHYIKPPSPFFRAKQKTAGPLFSENLLQSPLNTETFVKPKPDI